MLTIPFKIYEKKLIKQKYDKLLLKKYLFLKIMKKKKIIIIKI